MLSNFTSKKPANESGPMSLAASSPAVPPAIPQVGAPRPAVPAQTAARPVDKGAASVIGPDLTILGNLISKGEVHVDGEVQGDIHGSHITIGEKAKITGSIIAEEVVVRGHVMGSIRGRRVMLQSSSHVDGDIYHQALSIEQGAFFEGKSRRAEDPTAGVARPEISNGTLPVPGGAPTV
jgi:cytoskeletal protein CcmA (bactofilin family)